MSACTLQYSPTCHLQYLSANLYCISMYLRHQWSCQHLFSRHNLQYLSSCNLQNMPAFNLLSSVMLGNMFSVVMASKQSALCTYLSTFNLQVMDRSTYLYIISNKCQHGSCSTRHCVLYVQGLTKLYIICSARRCVLYLHDLLI
jgi:hypothetical protein